MLQRSESDLEKAYSLLTEPFIFTRKQVMVLNENCMHWNNVF